MTFLPIVVRELRVAARRKSTFRTRFWTAFTAIAFGSYLVCVSDMMGSAGGNMAFNILIGMCFVSCLSLVRNTNDCISEEKREGTLGLLFLTDLKGHDIALGKLMFLLRSCRFTRFWPSFPIVVCDIAARRRHRH